MLGLQKEALWPSALFGWTTEGSASEGGSAVRVDSAKDFPMEPEGTDAAVEEVRRETVAKATEAISSFGSALTFCE